MAYGSYYNDDDPYGYQYPDAYDQQQAPQAPAASAAPTGQPGLTNIQTAQVPAGAWNPLQALPASPAAHTDPFQTGTGTGYGAVDYNGDPRAYVQQIIQQFGLQGKQADPAALNAIVQGLKGRGVNVALDTRSDGLHKGIMLNGQFVKLLDGNDNWTWLPGGDAPGGGDAGIDPSYLAPYGRQFQAPADSALPQFQAPGAFHMPTMADVMADPGYKFREGRITDSISNSASAAGLLNSTGTLDRIMGSIGDFAGQEYGNVFNRNFNLWNTDYGHALDQYNLATNRANTSYDRGRGEFGLDRDIFYQNQDRPYDKIMRGVDLGSRVAGL